MASYTRDSGYGPVPVKTVTKRFESRLRGVLGRINAAIRQGIIKDDVLNLRESQDTLAVDDPGPFDTDNTKPAIMKFVQWLREELNSEFLTVVGSDENPYIRSAYATGIRMATSQLQEAGVDIADVDIESVLEDRRFDTALQTLYTRTYENLESVRDAVVSDVRDTLLEGYQEGKNPTEIAKSLTDRVDSVGKHRATLIARSETINAATEGSLDRYEQTAEDLDVDVGVQHVGRLTANDPAVCAFCRRTEGETFTIDEFRDTTVLFRGSTYRLAPPSHPAGRCAVTVKVGVDSGDLPPLSERVPGQLLST